jgi:hypothetical protein
MASFGSTMTLPSGQKLAIRKVERRWEGSGVLRLDGSICTIECDEVLRLTLEPIGQ